MLIMEACPGDLKKKKKKSKNFFKIFGTMSDIVTLQLMVNTEIRLIIFFVAKYGKALYS